MTDMTVYRGGLGIAPCGHTTCGGQSSPIEPRFLSSRPADRQRNVPVDQVLRFFVYGYSSWTDIPNITVSISEDAGLSFVPAFDSTGFLAPYDGANSKIIRVDGHTLAVYIDKVGDWPRGTKVVVQYSGQDEYGQDATRVTPVLW